MRFRSLFALSLLLAGTAAVAIDLPASLPKRKPGLWVMQSSGASAAGRRAMPKICIDEATDKALYRLGAGMSGVKCSRMDVQMSGSKIIADSTCAMQGPGGPVNMTSHSETVFDGDTAYRTTGHATYSPAFMGKTASDINSEGHWVGACPAGQKPGDMTLPNGMVVNVMGMAH